MSKSQMHGWVFAKRFEIASKDPLKLKNFSMDSLLSLLKLRLKTTFKLDQRESELEQEMRFHLENLIEENLKNGIELENAQNEALKKFGDIEEHKGECRGMWWKIPPFIDFKRGIRLTVHSIWKSPGFRFAVIGTLALCIGAISALYGLVLKPVSFENSEPLVQVPNSGKIETSGNGFRSFYSLQTLDSKERNDFIEGITIRKPSPKPTNRNFSIMKVQAISGNEYVRKQTSFKNDRPYPMNKESYPSRGHLRAHSIKSGRR